MNVNNTTVGLYQQWGDNNTAQQWFLNEATGSTLSSGNYTINSTLNLNYGLSIYNGSLLNSSNYSSWFIEEHSDGNTIKDLTTGLYLTAEANGLLLREKDNSINQYWAFNKIAENTYTIYSKYNYLVVDVSGASTNNNTPVILYQQWGDDNKAQKWVVTR